VMFSFVIFLSFLRRLDCLRWRHRKPDDGFPSTANRFFLKLFSGASKTNEILRKMRCFYGTKTNPSQALPTHHAAFSKRLFSVDTHGASRLVESVSFRRGDLVDLAVVQPDSLSVGDRIGHRFDEVVQIRFLAMPDW